MPIPNFDHNNVIPPYVGSPTNPNDVSPYICSIVEFCNHFATSKHRIEILKNYLEFRRLLNQYGIIKGFQWLDGSFSENIEVSENRPPNDLDLVTFFGGLNQEQFDEINLNFKEFFSPSLSKQNYKLDHYPVDFCYDPNVTVESTRYWIQLFSHNRHKIWKGILRIELNTPTEDIYALNYLNSL